MVKTMLKDVAIQRQFNSANDLNDPRLMARDSNNPTRPFLPQIRTCIGNRAVTALKNVRRSTTRLSSIKESLVPHK